jgi:DNA polymerase-1
MSKPPMQQIPRSGGVRECIAAPPGRTLVIADYDGAELRGLGQAMLDADLVSPMAELYQADPHADAHADFGASMLGIKVANMKAKLAAKDPAARTARQRAKAGNFGFPGGMGPSKFVVSQRAQGAHFAEDEAKVLRDAYMARWKVQPFFDYVQRSIATNGGVRLKASGRKRAGRFPQCANYCFQGLIADVAKRACWLVVWECLLGDLAGCKLVHFVHDELIIECDESTAQHVAKRVEQLMVQAGRDYMPDVPMTVSPVISRKWTKT